MPEVITLTTKALVKKEKYSSLLKSCMIEERIRCMFMKYECRHRFYVAYRRELSSRCISLALSECISTTLVLQHKLHSSEFSQEEYGNE